MYDFKEQLNIGKLGEEYFEKLCKKSIEDGRMSEFLNVTNDEKYWHKDIDYICTYKNGKRLAFEIKYDTTTTGNIFAETNVNTYYFYDNNVCGTRTKLGWLYRSKADFIFYYFGKLNIAYIISRNALAYWIDYCSQGNKLRTKTKEYVNLKVKSAMNKGTNCCYFGVGYCVPIKDIKASEFMKDYFYEVDLKGL